MNAERMYNSAQRLEMPPFPKDKFVEAVKQVVSANAAWVPALRFRRDPVRASVYDRLR